MIYAEIRHFNFPTEFLQCRNNGVDANWICFGTGKGVGNLFSEVLELASMEVLM